MIKCHCPIRCPKLPDDFFDLTHLKDEKRKVDTLIAKERQQNPNLKNYYRINNAMPEFNDITTQLIQDFKHRAQVYIEHIIANKYDYGTLYLLAQSKTFNYLYIEYTTFPLIYHQEKKLVMAEIEKMAKHYYTDQLMYKITCLELLYFYALLVNPKYNWIIMDYISCGNKNHQYVMSDHHRQNQANNQR